MLYKLSLKLLLILVLTIAFFEVSAAAALATTGINRQINFQGKVVKKDGTNVTDGNYDFQFNVYNAGVGGTLLWTETWNVGTTQVAVTSGIFNVQLGTYTTFPATMFTDDSLYLTINYSSDGEMSPRIRLTATPYALNAEKVVGLSIPGGKTVTFGESFTTTGIGISLDQNLSTISSVNFAGLSIGSTTITSTAKEINYLHNLAVGATGGLLYTTGVGITQLNIGTSGYFLSSDGTNPIWVAASLGAGTTYTATNGLNLNGSVFGLGGTLTQNTKIGSSSFSFSFLGLGNTQGLYIASNGNVAIGMTNPITKLQVFDTTGNGGTLMKLETLSNGLTGGYLELTAGTRTVRFGADGWIGPHFGSTTKAGLMFLDNNSISPLVALNVSNTAVDIGTTTYRFRGIYSSALDVAGTLNATTILQNGSPIAVGTTYTATNGLTLGTGSFGLGGTLTQNTSIGLSGNSLSFLGLGNTQSLFIASSGNVGIGTTNPAARLDVLNLLGIGLTNVAMFQNINNAVNNNGVYINIGSGDTTSYILNAASNNGTPRFYIRADGSVGIGTTAPGYKLEVVGNANFSTALNVGSTLVIGSSSNIFTFDPTKGPVYTGTARPSKVITLAPEYAGATLTKDGSTTNDGSMTSDNSLNTGGVGWKNYYEWSSTNAALQDYSVIVRVALPMDFDSWEVGSCPGSTCALEFNYQTGVGTTSDNNLSVRVASDTDTPGTNICTIGSTASTSWSSTGCVGSVLSSGTAPQWNGAGQVAVVRIKMAAKNTASALARAGDIILRYKAKF